MLGDTAPNDASADDAADAPLLATPTWEFRGPIVPRSMGGTLTYTVVHLPDDLAAAIPTDAGPNVRVYAVVNEIDVEAAFQLAHGRWSMMVSKALQRAVGARPGDVIDVRFSLAPPTAVDVPDALRVALRASATAARTFAGLSAGKQRALCHRVRSAKTAPTTARRVDEVVAALAGGTDAIAAFFGRKQPSSEARASSSHKPPAKKPPAKKPPAKKPPAKKPPAKKPPAKKPRPTIASALR